MHESPAFGEIWGDSKWAEICQWDFYQRTGRTADATGTFNSFMANRDDLPQGARGAAWFRDWFHPLWQESGGNMAFMDRFLGLLNQHFPKELENDDRNLIYTRRMTAGEYVHFMSGAVGRDLSGRAQTASTAGSTGRVRAGTARLPRDHVLAHGRGRPRPGARPHSAAARPAYG